MKKAIVLVVEDEALIRLDAVQMIEDAGYDVVEAANADEAILVLEQNPEIHIVFTDVNMPGSMDGLKLVHAIRNRWPPVLLLVTSGKATVNACDLPHGGRFLPKPYTAHTIGNALHALMN